LSAKFGADQALTESSKQSMLAGLPVDGVIGRGRRRPVRSAANVAQVEELICSQEDAP